MNNKLGISNKDWINLSAYIDGALSEQERARLDKRLAESKDLQQELANLQRLKAAVHALPKKKAPRDFMLTPDMVKARKPQANLFASFRLASVAATILFLVAFAGEAILKGNIFQGQQPAALEMEAALSRESDQAVEDPQIITWGYSPEAKGLGGGGGVGGAPMAGSAEPMMPIEESPIELEVEIPQDQPSLMAEPQEEELELASPGTGEALILGLRPETEGQVIEAEKDVPREQERGLNITTLRWVQGGLAAIALITGLIALILHFRRKRQIQTK